MFNKIKINSFKFYYLYMIVNNKVIIRILIYKLCMYLFMYDLCIVLFNSIEFFNFNNNVDSNESYSAAASP